MKVVLLNGMRQGETGPMPVYEALKAQLDAVGHETTFFELRDIPIEYCSGCFGCWTVTPGECVKNDAAREIARAMAQSDLFILFTPVTFGGYSSELKKALDRMLPNILPHFALVRGEFHHEPRYPKRPSLLGIGVLPTIDDETKNIFKTLVRRNALNFLPACWAAGVVCSEQEEEKIRGAVRALLAQVEVAS